MACVQHEIRTMHELMAHCNTIRNMYCYIIMIYEGYINWVVYLLNISKNQSVEFAILAETLAILKVVE